MMLLLPLTLLAAIQVSCTPSDITQLEARHLAIAAAETFIPKKWGRLEIEPVTATRSGARQRVWTFRVFTETPDPESGSPAVVRLTVNKRTAEVIEPDVNPNAILGRSAVVSGVEREQQRLRAVHCLKGLR